MPIIANGKTSLQRAIQDAFESAKTSGQATGADPDEIIANLSSEIADAVDAYVTSIVVQINPGGLTATGDTIVTPQVS